MEKTILNKIDWNEIPQYSSWVKVFLDDKGVLREKSPKEVWREYNDEKWRDIHKKLYDPSVTLSDLERDWMDQKSLQYDCDIGLVYKSMRCFRERQLDLYSETLASFANCESDLVELGAGYGSIFYPLWRKLKNLYHGGFAGEYANTGIEAMRALGKRENIHVQIGKCDFFKKTKDSVFEEIQSCILFTSYALCCVPLLDSSIIDYFNSFRPNVVVHFEPCYEYCDEDSLYGLLCRKYIEINDYNRNLVSVLKNAEAQGKIKIIETKKTVLGNNAWLPISIIIWKPVERCL